MKTHLRRRRFLFLVLIAIAGMMIAPRSSPANTLDTFASLVDAVPGGAFPVSGDDIRKSEKFFTDLKNANSDVEVLKALDANKDAPIFKSVTGDIPSWVFQMAYAYIAFREDDAFGVLEHMGKAALCLIAQYVAAGGAVDVCGVLEMLADLAEGALDAAKQLAAFAVSLGEGFVEGLESAGCDLFDIGCDDSPPPPPEYYAYEFIFGPKVAEGVKKIEESYGAFNLFLGQLQANAKSDPPKLSKSTSTGSPLMDGYLKKKTSSFSDTTVKNASQMYVDAVHKGWSADMKTVLPALAKKRAEYGTPQKIAELAQKAAAKVQSESSPLALYVADLCEQEFRTTLGFEHVDRWITDTAHQKAVAELKPVMNRKWCETSFWPGNTAMFAKQLEGFVKDKLCPAAGPQKFQCQKLEPYRKCLGVLGSVDRKGECGVNMTAVGQEAAKKIQDYFVSQGSEIPCTIRKTLSKPGSPSTTVGLDCVRPILHARCESTYKSFFGQLPVKLLVCGLNEDPKYKVLKDAVKKSVGTLKAGYGDDFYVWDLVDPLAVHAPSKEIWEKVQKAPNQDFGFSPPSEKKGFNYVLNPTKRFDGLSTPELAYGVDLLKAGKSPAIEGALTKLDLVKPGDPDPFGKTAGAGKLSSGVGGTLAAAPGAVSTPKGPDLGGVPAPAPTSGKLPSTGERSAAVATAEIRSGPRVTVAGKFQVAWGQGVTVSDADARRAANGVCEVAVAHDALNVGKAASGPFGRRWANQQNPAAFTDTYPSIPAGGSLQRTDTLSLKPGANRLTFALDNMNQVKETNENDNIYQLTITVNGTCGQAPGTAPAPVPGGRLTPGTRLPAGR